MGGGDLDSRRGREKLAVVVGPVDDEENPWFPQRSAVV
jgi:hypothetical protein